MPEEGSKRLANYIMSEKHWSVTLDTSSWRCFPVGVCSLSKLFDELRLSWAVTRVTHYRRRDVLQEQVLQTGFWFFKIFKIFLIGSHYLGGELFEELEDHQRIFLIFLQVVHEIGYSIEPFLTGRHLLLMLMYSFKDLLGLLLAFLGHEHAEP